MELLRHIFGFITLSQLFFVTVYGQEKTLKKPIVMWTQKSYIWSKVRGIYDEPKTWVPQGQKKYVTSHTTKHGERYGITYDQKSDSVIWTDKETMSIYKQTINDSFITREKSSITRLLSTGSKGIHTITTDWITGNLYFTDIILGYVAMASVTKPNLYRILANANVEKPNGIAANPISGRIYWTDAGTRKIESSTMYGWDRKVLVDSNIVEPHSMTLDYTTDRLYWVDRAKRTLEYYDLNTQSRHVVVTTETPSLLGISVYENHLFVTDEQELRLDVYNKETGAHERKNYIDAAPYQVYVAEERSTEPHDCDNRKCEHFCVNNGRTEQAKCQCAQGYTLGLDGISCRIAKPTYVFATGDKVQIAEANISDSLNLPVSLQVRDIATNMQDVRSIAASYPSGHVFYNDLNEDVLYRSNQDGGSLMKISVNTRNVLGMATDWLMSRLYWTDADLGHVMVSQLDGRYHSILLEGLSQPGAIAVDAYRQKLYLVVGDAILKSDLDGSESQELVDITGQTVNGLVVDVRNGSLYWTDDQSRQVYRSGLDGSNIKAIHSSLSAGLYDVTVYQGYSTWTTDSGLKFAHMDSGLKINGSGSPTGLQSTGNRLYDVILFNVYAQPEVAVGGSSCYTSNGGCAQHCYPRQSGHVCGCAIGFKLDADKKTCISDTSATTDYLLFVDPYHRQIYKQEFLSGEPQGLKLAGMERPTSVDYLMSEETFYWIEAEANTIRYSKLGDTSYGEINLAQGANPVTLVVDPRRNRVVFTDAGRRTISFATLDDSNRVDDIISDVTNPHGLAVDLNNGTIYWSETGPMNPRIVKASSEGDRKKVILDKDLGSPEGISLNMDGDMLFIADRGERQILSVNITDDTRGVVYRNGSLEIHAVTTIGNDVYFTTWNEKGLYKVVDGTTPDKELIGKYVFARLFDLKAITQDHNIPVLVTTSVDDLIPFIAGGAGAFLFLLLALLLLAFCLRRREKPKTAGAAAGADNGNAGDFIGDEDFNEHTYANFNNEGLPYTAPPAANGHATPATEHMYGSPPSPTPPPAAITSPNGAVNPSGAPTTGQENAALTAEQQAALAAVGAAPAITATVVQRKKKNLFSKKSKKGTTKFSELNENRYSKRASKGNDDFAIPQDQKVATKIQRAVGRLRKRINSFRWSGYDQDQTKPPEDNNEPEVQVEDAPPMKLVGEETKKATGNKPPYVYIPPKLHSMPQGFKPASRGVPTAVKATWGKGKGSKFVKSES